MEIREQEEEGDVGRREIVSNLKVWGVGSWELGLGKGKRERECVCWCKKTAKVWFGREEERGGGRM